MLNCVNRIIVVGAFVAASAFAGPAVADDAEACVRATGDIAIAACTRYIGSGQQTPYNLAIAYNNRGGEYRAMGDLDHAIADFNEAIRLDPNFATSFNNRGLVYLAKKDYDRAIADYNEAMRIDPNDTGPFYLRGNAYSAKNEYDRAIADYNEMIRRDPTFALAFYSRGKAKQKNGDAVGGDADIAKAKAMQPGIGK